MKRAVIGVLILSLVALPTFAGTTEVRGARCVSLEHIRGGWQMEIQCDQSKGAIVLLDAGDHPQYIGHGMFSRWSQKEMMELYRSLLPKAESNFELMQLG